MLFDWGRSCCRNCHNFSKQRKFKKEETEKNPSASRSTADASVGDNEVQTNKKNPCSGGQLAEFWFVEQMVVAAQEATLEKERLCDANQSLSNTAEKLNIKHKQYQSAAVVTGYVRS